MSILTRQTADEILERKERRGLFITTSVRLFFLVLLIAGHTFTYQNPIEMLTVSIIAAAAAIASIYILFTLKTKKKIRYEGFIGVGLDSIILSVLPIIWYISIGGSALPSAYMTKTLFTVTCFIFIIIHTLALRPQYPLIVGAAAACINSVILLYTAIDPRTVFSTTIIDIAKPEVVVINLHISVIISTLLIAGIAAFITFISRKMVYEAVRLEKANSQLSAYFPPDVAETISSEKQYMELGGITQNVAVLFADIRGFTAISETNPPETVLKLLAQYHETMVGIIFHHGGTLDKFIGDGIMATFGTPHTKQDDIERAVNTGISMRDALPLLNENLSSQGLPVIQIGIGIHYGQVIAGNIGSSNRLEYTVIGDTVNTASRVESACKATGETLLFTRAITENIRQIFSIRQVGKFQLKGKAESIELFTID